jgi:TonB family protein
MTHRMLTALFILLFVAFGVARGRAQANEAAQAPATVASPAPAQRILTKDPEYLKLLNPPLGNDFLQAYSKGYREKSAEIEASVAGISDKNLRSEARSIEWARLLNKDRDRFSSEAEVAFNDAKVSFLRNHRDDLFEVGRIAYDENNNALAVNANPTAPIDARFRVTVNRATIDQVYDEFRQIAGQDIDQKTREYVSTAGGGSICSRNPDWCYKFAKEEIERSLRSQRMIVVAQGDVESRKIDRLLLVDYDTEVVLLELDPHVSSLETASWRFSVGLVPGISTEARPLETQFQPATVASTEPGPSANPPTGGATTGNGAESSSSTPTSSNILPPRLRVPGMVTAAAIVTRTTPRYPPQARAGHIQGDVILHAIIDKEGKISELQVLAGDDLLAQSALQAVRQWRYKPMLFDGEPAEVDTTITITFSLLD